MWHKTCHLKPLPPKERRMPGRPTILRKRHESEKQGCYKRVSTAGRVMTCSNCHETGHSSRYCKNDSRVPPQKPPVKRGRPRSTTPATTSLNQNQQKRSAGGQRGKRGLVDVQVQESQGVDGSDLVDVQVQESQGANTFVDAPIQESQGANTFVDAPIQESQTFEGLDVEEAAGDVLHAAEEVFVATQEDNHPQVVVDGAAEVLDAAMGVYELATTRITKPFIRPRNKSERILKNKLKNFKFGKDGEGSSKEKSFKID